MAEEDKIQIFKQALEESSNVVFFGGAGVSTESGIPDFRSVDGLYNQKWDWPPEEILSATFFWNNTKEFYRFYREKLLIKGIEANITHKKLAQLEAQGKVKAVITQNIDGLHQKAGSKTVWELHGTTLKNYCTKCGKFFDIEYISNLSHADKDGIPVCDSCGAIIKPDVVLYEEGLNDHTVNEAVKAIENADMLIIGGTSLTVFPAAGLIRYFRGKHLVLINRDPTPNDSIADICIHDSLGKVFSQV